MLYRDFNASLRETFGCRVQKITLDAGLTCPNRDGTLGKGGCIYCNERGSGTGAARNLTITQQIAEAKPRLARRYKATKFLAYFQSFSNTYAPLPVLQSLYEEALADPDIVGLSIGTRPDCVSDGVLDYLAKRQDRAAIWMEYGLQSAHDATLDRIHRRHTVADFIRTVERTRARGIGVCAHIILGLPGETPEHMRETARFLARLDIQAVKIHLLYVVRGTPLEDMFRAGAYRPLTREEYSAAVAAFLTLLPPHIIIQRLTGDPHPEELVVPLWALEKQRNLEFIRHYMEVREDFQGKAFGGRVA